MAGAVPPRRRASLIAAARPDRRKFLQLPNHVEWQL
jgi:hypothetical protein